MQNPVSMIHIHYPRNLHLPACAVADFQHSWVHWGFPLTLPVAQQSIIMIADSPVTSVYEFTSYIFYQKVWNILVLLKVVRLQSRDPSLQPLSNDLNTGQFSDSVHGYLCMPTGYHWLMIPTGSDSKHLSKKCDLQLQMRQLLLILLFPWPGNLDRRHPS